tara:strand:- start:42 stop:719 length:678 start_codon:yes stop_codon:yes gene_type:complete
MGRLGKIKRQLIEESNKRLLGESTDPLFNDDFDRTYIKEFCKLADRMVREGDYGRWNYELRKYNIRKLKELRDKDIINLTTEKEVNHFILELPNRIYDNCDYLSRNRSQNIVRGLVEDVNKKNIIKLIYDFFNIKDDDTNFDKEKVTDDLANKTTIKDGVVHVPFSVDDFPKEDWDLYFEDFEVSNKKFGFTDYIVKEYGAGEVDSEEIWKEYQEAILHRLMNEG